jgi:hypothetical protein
MSTLALFPGLEADPHLPANAKLLYQVIRRSARPECWLSTDRLAKAIGCCKRTVQAMLRRLSDAGWIQVVRDYHLRSRHRIILCEREASDDAQVSANVSPGLNAEVAPSPAAPPDPPYKEPEGAKRREPDDDRGNAATGKASSSSSSVSSQVQGEGNGDPDPEREAAVIAKAEQVFGAGEWIAGKVRGLAGRWGLSWIDAALGEALRYSREVERVRGWGFVVRVLEAFRREGGPPPPLKPVDPWMGMTDEEAVAAIRRRAKECGYDW